MGNFTERTESGGIGTLQIRDASAGAEDVRY